MGLPADADEIDAALTKSVSAVKAKAPVPLPLSFVDALRVSGPPSSDRETSLGGGAPLIVLAPILSSAKYQTLEDVARTAGTTVADLQRDAGIAASHSSASLGGALNRVVNHGDFFNTRWEGHLWQVAGILTGSSLLFSDVQRGALQLHTAKYNRACRFLLYNYFASDAMGASAIRQALSK